MWEVFARRKFEEPLYHVGTVAADDPDLAEVYARSIFDEFTWVEMVLYPRAGSIHAVKT
jgi:1,2-phenylacetyl-CoA epoxidase PaaB subunit